MAHTDPWNQLTDLDGREKYRILQVSYSASAADIKKAYRELARKCHPDKGGDPASFSRIQDAFETLSTKTGRAVYDEWAREVRYRYVRSHSQQGQGGEGVLLDELAEAGLKCDPLTQLVLLCEVCGRPSTKECWTCKMPICSFCTLKRHWKDSVPLHWPLINSSHMETRLAKRELERKRNEDAKLLDMEDPHWRSEAQLKDIRSFKTAACKILDRPDRLVCYNQALARFYTWEQTQQSVFIAVHVPTGYGDRELDVDCSQHVLRIQPQESPPIVERAFDGLIDTSQPIDTFRTQDNQILVVILAKAHFGQRWRRLFQGDSDGIRCLQPPYQIAETEHDVTVEAVLPIWVDSEDVKVAITADFLSVKVEGIVDCRRSYWRPQDDKGKQQFEAVDIAESMWTLDEGAEPGREPSKVLLISLVKPQPTEDEVAWKKGRRQDNRNADRPGSMTLKGFRFFADDEDEFGLEDILQAVCFIEVGETFAPAKPWRPAEHSRRVKDAKQLDIMVQDQLKLLMDERSNGEVAL